MVKEFIFYIIYDLCLLLISICMALTKIKKDNAVTYWSSYFVKVGVPIIGIIFFGIPLICDLPYIIENNYCYMDGTVIEVPISNKEPIGNHKTVYIQNNETEEIFEISIRNAKLLLDETVKVKYLPNLKIGIVLEDNKWNEEISNQMQEKTGQQVEQMRKIALMEALLIVLVISTLRSGKKKKEWMVYPEIGIYKRLILAVGSCIVAIIILCFETEETAIKWSACLTTLAVLLFIIGMLFQCMGIRKEGSILVIVPLLGKKRSISEDEISKIVFEKKDFIKIMVDGKTLLRITKQFHGYEELRDILRKNDEECQQ